jgi:hypothetical protein
VKHVKPGKNTDDWREFYLKKTIYTTVLISAVITSIEADQQMFVKSLASAHGTSVGTSFPFITKILVS